MHDEELDRWQHDHTFGQDARRPGESRTRLVIALTAVTMAVEIAAGLAFGSMALLADGETVLENAPRLRDVDAMLELLRALGAKADWTDPTGHTLAIDPTGVDDFEWGVTLFAQKPDDLKEVVYTMRYDEASAVYAEFGAFYTGMVAGPAETLTAIGVI